MPKPLSAVKFLVGVGLFSLLACSEPGGQPAQVRMQFDRAGDFFAAPFPSDDLRRGSGPMAGSIDVSRFPNPGNVALIRQTLAILGEDARGFGLASGVFFSLRGPEDALCLPQVDDPMAADSPVVLYDLDRGLRHPIRVGFRGDGGPFGGQNLLTLLPVQGIPLREKTRYAAVVRKAWPARLTGYDCLLPKPVSFTQSAELEQLIRGERPAGLSEAGFTAYQAALVRLAGLGIAAADVAGLATFTTDDPQATIGRFYRDLLARPRPQIEAPFVRREVFADYCVYQTTIPMLDYQQGTPPYMLAGGGWAVDGSGQPVAPHPMRSNFWLTVPRRPMPAAGYPTVVFVRTGGGGDRPLVDRVTHTTPTGPSGPAGSGPALHFTRAGYAALSVDGPLGGLRNPDAQDEQFLIFNILNPTALRDNLRQSAIEIAQLAHIVGDLNVDTGDCLGAPARSKLDIGKLALMGHSTGSVIATLAAAIEPRYGAVLLSGAGGSWIENVLHKRKPIDVKPFAELIIGYANEGRSLHEFDPALSLVQWAAEPADAQIYAQDLIARSPGAPRHVLMMQGIVDNYIRPPIALSEAVPLGVDLAGPALDSMHPDLMNEHHLLDVLPLVGGRQISLPVSGNLRPATAAPTRVTGVVVQHPQDEYEDGHEVVFQTDAPKHQYRCFLSTWLTGLPTVVPGAAADAACP